MSSPELAFLIAFHGIEGFQLERLELSLADIAAAAARQNSKYPRQVTAEKFLHFKEPWKGLEQEVNPVRAEIEYFSKAFGNRIEVVQGYRKKGG